MAVDSMRCINDHTYIARYRASSEPPFRAHVTVRVNLHAMLGLLIRRVGMLGEGSRLCRCCLSLSYRLGFEKTRPLGLLHL